MENNQTRLNELTGKFLLGGVIVSLALAPAVAFALGIGQIQVRSALNQRLTADIPLLPDSSRELNSLTAEVAYQVYAGGSDARGSNQFTYSVIQRGGGSILRIVSERPFREPLVNLLVELRWDSGRLVREFAVLLDPAGAAGNAALDDAAGNALLQAPPRQNRSSSQSSTQTRREPASEPEPAPASSESVAVSAPAPSAPEPVAAEPEPVAVAPQPSPSAEGQLQNGRYGPVASGESLWAIAERTRPTGTSTPQMMQSILRANPQAFIRGNPDTLMRGVYLDIPGGGGTTGSSSGAEVVSEAPPSPTESAPLAIDTSDDTGIGEDRPGESVEPVEETMVAEVPQADTPSLPGNARIALVGDGMGLRQADLDDLRRRVEQEGGISPTTSDDSSSAGGDDSPPQEPAGSTLSEAPEPVDDTDVSPVTSPDGDGARVLAGSTDETGVDVVDTSAGDPAAEADGGEIRLLSESDGTSLGEDSGPIEITESTGDESDPLAEDGVATDDSSPIEALGTDDGGLASLDDGIGGEDSRPIEPLEVVGEELASPDGGIGGEDSSPIEPLETIGAETVSTPTGEQSEEVSGSDAMDAEDGGEADEGDTAIAAAPPAGADDGNTGGVDSSSEGSSEEPEPSTSAPASDIQLSAIQQALIWVRDPANLQILGGGIVALLALIWLVMKLVARRRSANEPEAIEIDLSADQDEFTEDEPPAPAPGKTEDPLERADMMLGLGDHQEAETVLLEALEDDPGDTALRGKLLEVYHQTGEADLFREQAAMLASQLGNDTDHPQWQRVAQMGRELMPNDRLFADDDGGDAPTILAKDQPPPSLPGDEDDEEPTALFETNDTETAATASDDNELAFDFVDDLGEPSQSPSSSAEDEIDQAFDFSFDDDDLGGDQATGAADEDETLMDLDASATGDGGEDSDQSELGEEFAGLNFDFEDDASAMLDSVDASPGGQEKAPVEEQDEDETLMDFDTDNLFQSEPVSADDEDDPLGDELAGLDFDLPEGEEPSVTESADDALFGGDDDGGDDLELLGDDGDADGDGEFFAAEDYVETKLDLANAYIDMEDPVGARSLLEEVLKEGNSEQQQRAEALMQRLS